MWAAGENCVAAPVARLLHTFFAFLLRWGPALLKFFRGGGEVGFSIPGSNFNSKIMIFPVIFWYIHIMLLHSLTLTT